MARDKTYTQSDIDSAKETQELHTTVRQLSVDMKEGFYNINQRLDVMNGTGRRNSESIVKINADLNNHCTTHKAFEEDIRNKVSTWSIIASIIGAVVAAVAALILWIKKVI